MHSFALLLSFLPLFTLPSVLLSTKSLTVHSFFFILFSFPLFPLHTDSLSNNPSIFVLEWRSNAFHLCASMVWLQGHGLPLFIHSPPLHFNSFPTKSRVWFHSALKSKISLHAGAPPGLRQQGEVSQAPGSVDPGSWRFWVTLK